MEHILYKRKISFLLIILFSVLNAYSSVANTPNYDAWGRYRNPSLWDYSSTGSSIIPFINRGYTGHEHHDLFGIINMNGRLYDPVVGRMLAVDNYVQAPGFTQNFNRYSYALNNPLKYNDPDGEFVNLIVGAAIGGVLNWAFHGFQFNTKGLGYFATGALAGAVGAGVGNGINTALAGGSFGAGFIGSTSVASTGFWAGAVSGIGAGFSSGFVNGFGNSAVGGSSSISEMFDSGIKSGVIGGIIGGVIGGVTEGIKATNRDLNFFSGKANFDLSNGCGASCIGMVDTRYITGTYKGQYTYDNSISIYETKNLGEGYGSGGITLPGRGIIVGKGAFSSNLDPDLLMHEYGHILQSRLIGLARFYSFVGIPSLASASLSPSSHMSFWTETWANYLSVNHFGVSFSNPSLYPIQNISGLGYYMIQMAGRFSILKP